MLDSIFGQQATPLEQAQIDEIYAKMGGNPNNGGGIWDSIFKALGL